MHVIPRVKLEDMTTQTFKKYFSLKLWLNNRSKVLRGKINGAERDKGKTFKGEGLKAETISNGECLGGKIEEMGGNGGRTR